MRQGTTRRWLRFDIWLLACLFAHAPAVLALHRVDPGETPRLGEHDGLLVVAVDSSAPLDSVKFRKVGTLFTAGILNGLSKGRTQQLYVVPEGKYRWGDITVLATSSWRFVLQLRDDDPQFDFEVKAGQITYAGDLVLRGARVAVSNRALPVIDWLRAQHAALYGARTFSYAGNYPDPFPEFYRKALAGKADVTDKSLPPPEPPTMPLSPKTLWTPFHVQGAALNPDGTLIAEIIRDKDEWQLQLVDIAAGTAQTLGKSAAGFESLAWKDDRVVLAESGASQDQLHAFVIGEASGNVRAFEHFEGPSGGNIVDLMPEKPGKILYEARDRTGTLAVHELDVHSAKGMQAFLHVGTIDRLNKGVDDDLAWYADGHGNLCAVLKKSGDERVLLYRHNGKFEEALRLRGNDSLQQITLSYECDAIYALSDEGREQRDLVVYDPAQHKITRTVFSKPGVDVARAIFDDRRNPIGVRYLEGGQRVSEYFDARDRHVDTLLRRAFPGKTAAVVDRNRSGDRMLLWVDGSDQPAQLYFLDAKQLKAQLIDEAMPELSGKKFAASQLLKVANTQGQNIEAFVTLPPGEGKHPLVVMPHGGPIGVSDLMHFDADVQFLASLGYAVLQVNFRGSEGYGRAFREAGWHQFGRGIEDDIDAALQIALARFPLDSNRMCMLGGSYGGYSALYSTIRWPDRFRCAVSISGVSDRILFFTASDGARTAKGRADLERYLGNPRTELDTMKQTSPLYEYARLTAPVMLAHGEEDERVDFEHTRRLVRMLDVAGRPPVLMTFPKEGHGFDDPKDLEKLWTGIAGFLHEHLDSAANRAPSNERAPPQ